MARPVGWILTETSRALLLDRFEPRYARIVAHHVTLASHHAAADVPGAAGFAVVGHAVADMGIEALVVRVDGKTQRPDGKTFHVTWSIDPASGCKPQDSNRLIEQHGFTKCDPIRFAATPGYVA